MAISFVGSAVGSSSPNAGTSVDVSGIGIQAGDLILVAAAVGDTANNGLAAPTQGGYSRVPGWAATLYGNGSTGDCNLDGYYKIADGSETAVSFGAVGGTNAANAAVVMVFRGVDQTTPFDTNANTTTGTSTAAGIDPPSHDHSGSAGVATVIAGATGHTGGATASGSAPANYSNFAQRAHDDSTDAYVFMAWRSNPADPENPGVVSPTPVGTASANGYAAATMSLKEAAAAVDATVVALVGDAVGETASHILAYEFGGFPLASSAVADSPIQAVSAGGGAPIDATIVALVGDASADSAGHAVSRSSSIGIEVGDSGADSPVHAVSTAAGPVDATIVALVGDASADGAAPVASASSSLLAPVGDASADAPIAAISSSSNVSIAAPIGDAVGEGLPATVAFGTSVSPIAPVGDAAADGAPVALSLTRNITIVLVAGDAVADSPIQIGVGGPVPEIEEPTVAVRLFDPITIAVLQGDPVTAAVGLGDGLTIATTLDPGTTTAVGQNDPATTASSSQDEATFGTKQGDERTVAIEQ